MENNTSNCWETVKPIKPKQRNEICSSGMVTKVERIDWMA